MPIKAIAHAGKPVNGSSPGLLAAEEARAPRTPFVCFASSFSSSGFVGGVETPADAPVVVGVEAGVVAGVDVVVGVTVVVVAGVFVVVVVVVGMLLLVVLVVVDVDVEVVVVVVVEACSQ